jgi:hypothetical protein
MFVMAQRQATARKGGASRKAPEGLAKVLFVRANQDLLDRLDELRQQRSAKNPGIVLSRADIARAILWEAIERGGKEKE